MSAQGVGKKRYEEYAYVIGSRRQNRSIAVKGRSGDMFYGIGEKFLNILEVMIKENTVYEIGSRVYIGIKERADIESVLGRVTYKDISEQEEDQIANVLVILVKNNEERFVRYMNTAGPITPRMNSLEMIPGIGKGLAEEIVLERGIEKFKNFTDIEKRTGLYNIVEKIVKRIENEISGRERICLFVKR